MSSNSNFQSIADWQPPETLPNNVPGQYLVIIRRDPREGDQRRPDELAIYTVKKISNGHMQMVGGHFAWDILTDRTRVVCWADKPEPPVWLEEPDVKN